MAPLPINPASVLALKDAIRDGTYPSSEDLLVADLGDDAVAPLLKSISDAQKDLENDIRHSSQDMAADVDEWIRQAKKMQEDIAQCKIDAQRIVEQYRQAEELRRQEYEAQEKVRFLSEEIVFTGDLMEQLKGVEVVSQQLRTVKELLLGEDGVGAASALANLGASIVRFPSTHLQNLLGQLEDQLRGKCVALLGTGFDSKFKFTFSDGNAILDFVPSGGSDEMSLDRAMDGLTKLDELPSVSKAVLQKMVAFLTRPLRSSADHWVTSFSVVDNQFTIYYGSKVPAAAEILQLVQTYLKFLQAKLPVQLRQLLTNRIHSVCLPLLISEWLTPAIPLDLSDLVNLKPLQAQVAELAEYLRSEGWLGHDELREWIEHVPRLWLLKRKANALDAVRRAYSASTGALRQVERVERQTVSTTADSRNSNAVDDWDANWDKHKGTNEAILPENPGDDDDDDDDDATGWGFDDEEDDDMDENGEHIDWTKSSKEETASSSTSGKLNGDDPEVSTMEEDKDDDENEAWGWDDEKPNNDTKHEPPKAIAQNETVANGGPHRVTKDITLTEYYSITDIPDHLVETIGKDIYDSQDLASIDDLAFKGSTTSNGLLALPTLTLAMFRATAPTYYTRSGHHGNMNLYNDSIYILERLHNLDQSTNLPSVSDDCKAMEKFGRSAYAKEMDIQRTILSDLLDGAQGFANCTKFPYSQEIERAVVATVDRLRQVHALWKPILSTSALLQSIGALLSTVISKVITDIEEMEDISEAESQALTTFSAQINSLEDLFLVEPPGSAISNPEPVAMTAVYVPNWLRFQYLINILESSLVDIGYLWTDGELSLEYSADEVVDLIKALFAESTHRRNAINSIRNHPARR